MADRLNSGLPVIVGAQQNLPIGCAVGTSRRRQLLVKRRATRQDFLFHVPEGADVSDAPSSPFYFELELNPSYFENGKLKY